MLKDRIIEILNRLTDVTNSNTLNWIEDDPKSKSRLHKRKMISTGEDGTNYEMEIKFTLKNDSWVLDEEPNLWVKNLSLPDGLFYITHFKSDGETIFLRNAILSKFCKDMSPTIEDVENTLSNIARGISISEFREGKINKILN
jgi:hypothetical protein